LELVFRSRCAHQSIYSQSFSQAEIDPVLAFYRTDAGRRVVKSMLSGQDLEASEAALSPADAKAFQSFSQTEAGKSFAKKMPTVSLKAMQAVITQVADLVSNLESFVDEEIDKLP
jgi:hypothetical protein